MKNFKELIIPILSLLIAFSSIYGSYIISIKSLNENRGLSEYETTFKSKQEHYLSFIKEIQNSYYHGIQKNQIEFYDAWDRFQTEYYYLEPLMYSSGKHKEFNDLYLKTSNFLLALKDSNQEKSFGEYLDKNRRLKSMLLQTLFTAPRPKMNSDSSTNDSNFFPDSISLFIAILALIIAFFTFKENGRVQRILANQTYLSDVELKMLDNPELLTLHNVDKELLNDCDINATELVYIITNLNAAAVFYRLKAKDIKGFSEYRKNFLDNPKVKKAWENIIKNKFISNKKFIEAIDKYYIG